MRKIKTNQKETILSIKIPTDEIYTKCGEQYTYYISESGDKKSILPGAYVYEGFFDSHYGKSYDCYTCGYHWEERVSKKSLLISEIISIFRK